MDVNSIGKSASTTHLHLNDNTVAGMRMRNKPVFSVQYHPEASPGPHDANYLFDQFFELIRAHAGYLKKGGIGLRGPGETQLETDRRLLGRRVKTLKEKLARMQALVRQAMEEGALGVGSSLIYAPAFYAKTAELVALAEEAGRHGGMYISHMRSEGNALLEAVDELITIAREAGVSAEIYHLKMAGADNWAKIDSVLQKIEERLPMITGTLFGTDVD